MKTLFVNACVRPESRTMVLAKHVLDKIGGEMEEVNLEKEKIQPLNYETMQQRDALLHAEEKGAEGSDAETPGAEMLRYARQFAEADTIVMAAPYWDLSFPAALKAYLEWASLLGVTFRYEQDGRQTGLCRAKALVYCTTAGGPVAGQNFGYDYIRALCAMFGIRESFCIAVEMSSSSRSTGS